MPFKYSLKNSLSIAILAIALFCVAHSTAFSQKTFSAPDSSFSLVHPDNWTISEMGGKYLVKAEDGALYNLTHDSITPTTGKDAAVDPLLHSAAETIAKGLLQNAEYGGVKILAVPGGTGAVYRFRGKGGKSDSDLVEVWYAVQGGHVLTLWPSSAPQADHGFELTVMFQNLPAGRGGPAASAGKRGVAEIAPQGKKNNKVGKDDTSSPPSSPTPTPAMTDDKMPVPGVGTNPLTPPDLTGEEEFETYEGHLLSGDITFKLHILTNNKVRAEWEKTVGRRTTYAGTYSGTDGSYLVNLVPVSSASFGTLPLRIVMRSLGGQINAGFSLGAERRLNDVAVIKLTGVSLSSKGKGKSKKKG